MDKGRSVAGANSSSCPPDARGDGGKLTGFKLSNPPGSIHDKAGRGSPCLWRVSVPVVIANLPKFSNAMGTVSHNLIIFIFFPRFRSVFNLG